MRFVFVLPQWLPMCLAASTLLLAPGVAGAGKLDQVQRSIDGDSDDSGRRDDGPERSRTGSGSGSGSGDATGDCDDLCESFLTFLFAPWTVPHALLGANGGKSFTYDDYPYRGRAGFIRFRPELASVDPAHVGFDTGASPTAPQARGQRVALQLDSEFATGFDVHRIGVGARVMFPVPVELDARWFVLWEAPDGGTDVAMLGAEHMSWRFAQGENTSFRTGIGPLHYIDATQSPDSGTGMGQSQQGESNRLGVDLFYGFESLVGRPFTLNGELHFGALGQAWVWQARASLGAMLGPAEVYGGYHHISIGGVSLGGPVVGARLWW